MPDALAMIGESAISSLEKYLLNLENGEDARAAAAHALQRMGEDDPDLRDRVVSILSAALEHYRENSEFLNGVLAANLVDLNAVESTAVIKAAYNARKVDLFPYAWSKTSAFRRIALALEQGRIASQRRSGKGDARLSKRRAYRLRHPIPPRLSDKISLQIPERRSGRA